MGRVSYIVDLCRVVTAGIEKENSMLNVKNCASKKKETRQALFDFLEERSRREKIAQLHYEICCILCKMGKNLLETER